MFDTILRSVSSPELSCWSVPDQCMGFPVCIAYIVVSDDLGSVNSRHITNSNMASRDYKKWVTFDEENSEQSDNEINQSKPWPTSRMEDKKSSQSLAGSLSSTSSGSSFMSASDSDSRGTSPTNSSEDTSKYLPFKELESVPVEQKEDDTPAPSSISNSPPDCKYSVFSSLRMSEDKGKYLGWSKKVLGEGVMGWSETLRAKPSF